MQKITQLEARNLITSSKGRMLTVKFTKKDGTVRKLNGRLGVSKGVQGTGRANNDPNLIRIAEMRRNERGHFLEHDASNFRAFRIERLFGLSIGGQEFEVIETPVHELV
jgi:hypothetical protein